MLHSMNTSLNQKMDDLKSEMSLLREELHGEVEQLRSEVRGLRKENEDLAKKVDDLQGRSKRNNIIIHGMMRPPNETSVDCEANPSNTRRLMAAMRSKSASEVNWTAGSNMELL
ncbi:hypothetical protein ACOMHN_059093 [Nucella lapillus]